MASKFMASKFVANAAFEPRLLLRPSHQRAVWTVNRLKCPIPGRRTLPPILSSRSYSDSTSTPTPPFPEPSSSTFTPTPPFTESSSSTSTPTPPFTEFSSSTSTPSCLKSSGSTESSQSSGPKDKNWSDREYWVGMGVVSVGGSFVTILLTGLVTYYTDVWQHVNNSIWGEQHGESRRCEHESVRESAIYNKLKNGPEFEEAIKYLIPRELLVKKIKELITPAEETGQYSLIVGEDGTGKTSLIKLAVNDMDKNKPKGIVYVDIPDRCDSEVSVVKAMREALGWSLDQVIDSKEPASVEDVLQVLSHHAIKYKHDYGEIPVLIIDNADNLAPKQQELLDLFQDYAKRAADEGIVTATFVSSEGRVPRHMMGRASWSRCGTILEINDVSEEEALQYLELRKIDKEQTAQIHELVGSRMVRLKCVADQIKNDNETLEAVRDMIFSSVEVQLESAEILPKLRYHKEGALVIRQLLRKESISRDTFYKLVGVSAARKLLETNIFVYHLNSREVTFRSTAVKRFCEEYSARWESGA